MRQFFINCIVVILVASAAFSYDANCYFAYSTIASLEIDASSLCEPKKIWYATLDNSVGMQSTEEVLLRLPFKAAMKVSESCYVAEVGAALSKSALLGRHGKMLWCGNILIVAETGSDSLDAYLVSNSASIFSVKLEQELLICSGIKMSDIRFSRE